MSERRRARSTSAASESGVPAELLDRQHPKWWPNGLMGDGPDSPEVLKAAYSGQHSLSLACWRAAKDALDDAQLAWCRARGLTIGRNGWDEIDWRKFGPILNAARPDREEAADE